MSSLHLPLVPRPTMLHHVGSWLTDPHIYGLVLLVFVPLFGGFIKVMRDDPKLRRYLPECLVPPHEKV